MPYLAVLLDEGHVVTSNKVNASHVMCLLELLHAALLAMPCMERSVTEGPTLHVC